MKSLLKTCLTMIAASILSGAVLAVDKTGHRFVAHSNGHVIILNAKGEIEWEVAMPFTSHGIQALPSGNFRIQNSITTLVRLKLVNYRFVKSYSTMRS